MPIKTRKTNNKLYVKTPTAKTVVTCDPSNDCKWLTLHACRLVLHSFWICWYGLVKASLKTSCTVYNMLEKSWKCLNLLLKILGLWITWKFLEIWFWKLDRIINFVRTCLVMLCKSLVPAELMTFLLILLKTLNHKQLLSWHQSVNCFVT